MNSILHVLLVLVLQVVNIELVYGQAQPATHTLTSCDGNGMVATISDVDGAYYTGIAYAQKYNESFSDVNTCGPNGTFWTLTSATVWTFTISLADMESGTCGTLLQTVGDPEYEYRVLLVVPRRDFLQLATDYRAVMICRWNDIQTWSTLNNLTGIDPIPDTNVTKEEETISGPTVEAQFLDTTDTLIAGNINLGDRVKLNIDVTDDSNGHWSHLLIVSLTARTETPDDANDLEPGLTIIENRCPDADILAYLNGAFETGNNNDPPVQFVFDSFRFLRDVPVLFDIVVRVCTNETVCSVTCPSRRKRQIEIITDEINSDKIDLNPNRDYDTTLTRPEFNFRIRRSAHITSAVAKSSDSDNIDSDHVDIGLQLVAMVESEDDVEHTGRRVDNEDEDDDSVFRKAPEEDGDPRFRIVDLQGHTETVLETINDLNKEKSAMCFNQSQLIIICVLALLMLLVTAAATAFSCCRVLFGTGGHRRYRRVASHNNVPPPISNPVPHHQVANITNERRCTNCGSCISSAEANVANCGCATASESKHDYQSGNHRSGLADHNRGLPRPSSGHHQGLTRYDALK